MNWPSMTMAFSVKDKALMEKIKKDQKVDFEFVQAAGPGLRRYGGEVVRSTAVALILLFAAAATFAQAPPRFGPNEGQVLEVDKEAGEIAIRHGYLPELDMDPMSMVFVVADVRLLDTVRKGDRVRFKPGLVRGRFGILEITPLRDERK